MNIKHKEGQENAEDWVLAFAIQVIAMWSLL
jgi:hypothetical protein